MHGGALSIVAIAWFGLLSPLHPARPSMTKRALQRADLQGSQSRRSVRRKRGAETERARELAGIGGPEEARPRTRQTQQPFRYLCVLDVEATCERGRRPYEHEIIEFPVVLVDLHNLTVVDEFHTYVRPTVNVTLTEFCTKLTGITQDRVYDAPTLDVVLARFDEWLQGHELRNTHEERQFAFAADGPWDLRFFIDGECARKGILKADYFDKWVNIKQLYADFYRCQRCKIGRMLEKQGMRFEGRLHSGIDDTRNIARIAIKMGKDGCKMYLNEALPINRRSAAVGRMTSLGTSAWT